MALAMRSLATLVAILAAGTGVSAGCYNSGDAGNKATATNNLDTVCKGLQGYYQAQQFRTSCISKNHEDTYWFFEVKQNGWGGTLDYKSCIDGLSNEINGCSRGGSSAHGDWNYRSDPGLGSCRDVGYINSHASPNSKGRRQVAGNTGNSSEISIVFGVPSPARLQDNST